MSKVLYAGLVIVLAVSMANSAIAADVGAAELNLLQAIFTGNIGLTLGLAIAIGGILAFVQGKTAPGITLIVLGALITVLPGVFNGMRMIACPIATALGGGCGGSKTP